jgi:hypothetical protein
MKRIEPAVEKRGRDIEPSIDENILCVKECILSGSPLIKKMAEEGKVKIVLAKYLLETGEVKVLG